MSKTENNQAVIVSASGGQVTATPTPAPTPAPAVAAPVATPTAPRQLKYGRRVPYKTAEPTQVPPMTVDSTLLTILSWKRGHGTQGEQEFAKWLVAELSAAGRPYDEKPMVASNGSIPLAYVLEVPRKDKKKNSVLFSCHIDTTERSTGLTKQGLCYDAVLGHIFLDNSPEGTPGSCLGADDGAGVWLMLKMIRAGIPGAYVFHRGEEAGCIGSRGMEKHCKDFLERFDIAIAFDRPNDNEVITHQRSQRCASDTCGTALAKALNDNCKGLAFSISSRGLFTDTAIYREIIPECFNLGVGYQGHHGTGEFLDYGHLSRMLTSLLKIDFDQLPVARDPEKEAKEEAERRKAWAASTNNWRSRHAFHGAYGLPGEEMDDDFFSGAPAQPPKPTAPPAKTAQTVVPVGKRAAISDVMTEVDGLTYDDIRDFVESDADAAVQLIIDMMAEVMSGRARIDTYRQLLGMNDE